MTKREEKKKEKKRRGSSLKKQNCRPFLNSLTPSQGQRQGTRSRKSETDCCQSSGCLLLFCFCFSFFCKVVMVAELSANHPLQYLILLSPCIGPRVVCFCDHRRRNEQAKEAACEQLLFELDRHPGVFACSYIYIYIRAHSTACTYWQLNRAACRLTTREHCGNIVRHRGSGGLKREEKRRDGGNFANVQIGISWRKATEEGRSMKTDWLQFEKGCRVPFFVCWTKW